MISNPFLPSPSGASFGRKAFSKRLWRWPHGLPRVRTDRSLRRLQNQLPAIFVADALGLDFLNSVATPVDTQIDRIDDGLLAWLEEAQLVPAETLQTLRAQAMPGEFNNSRFRRESLRKWFRGSFGSAKGGHSRLNI